MSQLQGIAGRLRALAQDASPISTNIAASARQLKSLADEVASLGRSGVNTGPLLSALQQAQTQAEAAADGARHVKSEGVAWANYLARGGAGGGSSSKAAPAAPGWKGGQAVPTVAEIQVWLPEVNPGYSGDPFDPRSNNCGQCAAAVHSRLTNSGNQVAGEGTLSTPEMESLTGNKQVEMSPSDIERELRAKGAGSHAVVGVDRADGPGHWFNAYFDGSQVVAIDGQSGTISPWPPDYGNVILWDAGIGD